ncbi:MAG: hypothetical protein UU25_C0036G0001, partial [Microgenomates group bacterium GW2011_GWB1_40_9]
MTASIYMSGVSVVYLRKKKLIRVRSDGWKTKLLLDEMANVVQYRGILYCMNL